MKKLEQERLDAANEFISVIASCGRNFFSENSDMRGDRRVSNPFVSTMEVDGRGKVWFTDYYTKKRIYTHYSGDWRGFTSGGTLRNIVQSLRDFIKRDAKMRKEYFQPDMGNGFNNPWGYGEDILKIKESAVRLGIAV